MGDVNAVRRGQVENGSRTGLSAGTSGGSGSDLAEGGRPSVGDRGGARRPHDHISSISRRRRRAGVHADVSRDRAAAIGTFWGHPETRTFGELLIDLEEDKAARAVVFGLLAEIERRKRKP